jgi:hypothetical protein
VVAIQELLQAREQLLVCAGCRFSTDHQAMRSTIKSCSTCGENQECTLDSYCSAWLRGLPTKGLQSYDRERDLNMTSYAQLGESLLAPHGKQVGLEYPDHRELGGDATFACKVEASSVVIGLEGGNTNQGNNHENMDTLESGALPPGADPLVTKFSKSANPKAMLDLVEGDYKSRVAYPTMLFMYPPWDFVD